MYNQLFIIVVIGRKTFSMRLYSFLMPLIIVSKNFNINFYNNEMLDRKYSTKLTKNSNTKRTGIFFFDIKTINIIIIEIYNLWNTNIMFNRFCIEIKNYFLIIYLFDFLFIYTIILTIKHFKIIIYPVYKMYVQL